MNRTSDVIMGLGNLILVIAIAFVTSNAVSVQKVASEIQVCYPGSVVGRLCMLLLIVYLVFTWVKFQYFATTFGVASLTVLFCALGTAFAACLYACSALHCLESRFGERSLQGMMASHVFAAGCVIHLVSDGFLVAKSADYLSRLRDVPWRNRWHSFHVAHAVYVLRLLVLVFLLVLAVSRSHAMAWDRNEIVEAARSLGVDATRWYHLVLVTVSVLLSLTVVAFSWLPEAEHRATSRKTTGGEGGGSSDPTDGADV